MALETLQGVEEIDGFKVIIMDELRSKYPEKFEPSGQMNWEWFEKDIRPYNFIYVRQDKNSLSFTIQNGPIKEVGVNGCQVDTVIAAAKTILEGLNAKFPSPYNEKAIQHLQDAIGELKERTKDREARGVEGTSKV